MMQTEIVYQISQENPRQILQEHFNLFYQILAESHLVPSASFENINGAYRSLSGIPLHYHNAILGCPSTTNADLCIKQQLDFFNDAKMPFIWCLNEDAHLEFKQKLIDHGFINEGVYQGVMGSLDQTSHAPEIPDDCVLELVQDEATFEEFDELLAATFGINGCARVLFKQVLLNGNKNRKHPMFHWIARKQGKAVAALTSIIDGNMVSFWNGASLPEVRRHGLMTALAHLAIVHAKAEGCRYGASYLTSKGLAFGICNKFGFETKWRFEVFLSPKSNEI